MARKAAIEKSNARPKYSTRRVNRCRICFRNLASEGKLPGVTKSSW